MTHNQETIIDELGIELFVAYDYEKSPSQIEEGHGHHEVGCLVYTELTSVGLFINNTPVPILDRLNEKQKEHIVSLLNYE
jgi:hypothetical protein